MYIEETGADDPVGNEPFHDEPFRDEPFHDEPAGNAGIDGEPGGAGVGGADAGIAGRGGSLLLDTPQGVRDVGPATEDTNGDGRPDTAMVDEGGGMLLVTDLDGDAAADQTVRIEDTGGVTVSRHTGPGQWTVVEQRGVGQGGAGQGGAGEAPPQEAPGAAGEPVPAAGSAPSTTDDAAWALGEPPALHSPQPDPAQPAPEQAAPGQPVPARQPSDAARPDADAVWA